MFLGGENFTIGTAIGQEQGGRIIIIGTTNSYKFPIIGSNTKLGGVIDVLE